MDSDRDRHLGEARGNRDRWDAESDAYQADHEDIGGDKALAWGVWRTPEAELRALGDVEDKDVLELGCGAAQWSIALAGKARVIGLDNSARQLEHARVAAERADRPLPLIQASGQFLPFAAESFDIVFCDYGAMTFADPARTVPEVARVLRPSGLLAFMTTSPFLYVCWPPNAPEVATELLDDYFGMHRFEEDGMVEFNLTYGDWIRLLRTNGLVIEDLIEPRPPEGATSSFPGRPIGWARRWPTESLWRARKS